MFLTGQFYPRPWEEPTNKPKEQPKDRNYFNNKDNIWNNPHRTSKKVSKFYHQSEQSFKKTHYTDQEINNIQTKQQQYEKHKFSQEKRLQSRERLTNRKTEREILQFKSNQHLEEDDIDQIGEIAVQEPELFDEMATKRAKSYKDPSRVKQPNMQLWNAINQLPTKQLSKILRPKIIEKDKNAAELIMQKIEHEKQIEQLQNQWFVQNRLETRQKFIDRHEKNIELEKKAGIQKEYQPVTANVNSLKANQGSGVIIQNRPYSAYNANSSTQSSKKAIYKVQNLLGLKQNTQQSEGQVTFRQKDHQPNNIAQDNAQDNFNNNNIHIQDGQNSNQQLLQLNNDINKPININAESSDIILNNPSAATNFQNYVSTQNLQAKRSSAQFSSSKSRAGLADNNDLTNGGLKQQQQSQFRISTAVQPAFYRTNKTCEKLHQVKHPYEPNKPFLQQDFRGLFTADHQEALSNCNEYDPEKHSTYITQQLGSTNKKSSNTVRELFPIPQGNKPSNLLMASNSGIASISKSFINNQNLLQYQTNNHNKSRQNVSSSRQNTPFMEQQQVILSSQSNNKLQLNDSPTPMLTDPGSSKLQNYIQQANINNNHTPFSAHTTQNVGGISVGQQMLSHNMNGNSALSVAFNSQNIQTPYTDCGNNGGGAKMLRNSQTAGNSRLVKRPFTAYKATMSQRAASGYGGHRTQTPHDAYLEQNGSFNSSQLVPRTIASSRQKQRLQQDILQAQQQLENEKDECMSQMDWFEKVNHLDVKRQNRYPQIAYEEALNYDERFAEHLANKKQKSPIQNDLPVETNQDNSRRQQFDDKSSNNNLIMNRSQNSIRQVATPSALSSSNI